MVVGSDALFTEISPLCEQDVRCVQAPPQKLSSTTPTGAAKSIKRKRNANVDNAENINPVSAHCVIGYVWILLDCVRLR